MMNRGQFAAAGSREFAGTDIRIGEVTLVPE